MVEIKSHRVSLGKLVATPGAMDLMKCGGLNPARILSRHASGDWGDLCKDDKRANDFAVVNGERLLSCYHLEEGNEDTKIWIITEWDRSVTTILLPTEY